MDKKHFDLVLDTFKDVVTKYLSDPQATPEDICRFIVDLNKAMEMFKTQNSPNLT